MTNNSEDPQDHRGRRNLLSALAHSPALHSQMQAAKKLLIPARNPRALPSYLTETTVTTIRPQRSQQMARQNGCKATAGLDPAEIDWREMLEKTTDLAKIRSRSVVFLLDEQNLSVTAKKLGYTVQYDQLARHIRQNTRKAEFRIFIASDPRSQAKAKRLKMLGYKVHVKNIRHKLLPNGEQRRDCNVDNIFAFWAGYCTLKNGHDVFVLGSGDYGLSGELSQAMRSLLGKRAAEIMTLSLPGSTAQDLDASRNKSISANLEIGLDLLRPLPAKSDNTLATLYSERN